MPERATPTDRRSEKSAEAVVAARLACSEGLNVKEGEARLSLEGSPPQMSRQLELPFMGRGETPRDGRSVEDPTAAKGSGRGASQHVAAAIAANARRWWKNASMSLHGVLTTSHFDALGLPRLRA
jgi:hypothetical protein